MAGMWETLRSWVTPREASAEIVAGDPGAKKLMRTFETSPKTLPAWAIPYMAAQARPERVTVQTVPGLIGLEDEQGRRAEVYGYYDPTTQTAMIGQGPAADIKRFGPFGGDPRYTLPHELGHFLQQVHGLPQGRGIVEEQEANAIALPVDWPLLQAGYAREVQKGQPLSLFWRLVQRQMEGARNAPTTRPK